MSVKVNSPCPCGSGKKAKKCCLKLSSVIPSEWLPNLVLITGPLNHGPDIRAAVLALLELLYKSGWIGACHTIAAYQYVIFKEMGLAPELKAGKVIYPVIREGYPVLKTFDHSWVEVDGKIHDLTIWRGLTGEFLSPPIIHDVELLEGKVHAGVYNSGNTNYLDGLKTLATYDMEEYFDSSPDENLWEVLDGVGTGLGITLDERYVRGTYGATKWDFV